MGQQKQSPGRQRTLSTPFPSFNLAQDCLKRRKKHDKSENVNEGRKHNTRGKSGKKRSWSCSLHHFSQQSKHGSNLSSIDGWMDKENVMYIYSGILFGHEKENPAICNMDGPCGHYAKWNKWDRQKQILYDLTYMWNLKNKRKNNKQKIPQAYRYREWIGVCQRQGVWRWAKLVKESKGTNFQL